ncbi:helix-turn-helix domain-containing protein [Brevibacillus brevis]|uniref:helix-turn-helix domain-containing protein n=1 Tax=Brevibacillus brevis TaxID=1393 RepID=UPI0037C6C3AD
MSFLGERLRKARERKNLKQVQVHERTGINNKTLSRYESGGSEPDVETLKVLAELYEVSLDWLTGHTEAPSPSEAKDKPGDELTTIMYHKWDQLDERRRKQALRLIEILEQEAEEENNKN